MNRQDATVRNVRAAKKRERAIASAVVKLIENDRANRRQLDALETALFRLAGAIDHVAGRKVAQLAVRAYKRNARRIASGVFLVLLATSLVGCASVYRVSQYAAGACHGADLYSTGVCIGAGRCTEGNWFLLRVVDQTPTFGIVKGATAVGAVRGVHYVYEDHPTLATTANFLQAGAFCAVAAHNSRVNQGR